MSEAKPAADKGRDLQSIAPPLAAWLGERIGADVTVSDFGYPVGAGHSNETIHFAAGWTDGPRRERRDLVLRIHPRQEYQMFLHPRFRMQFDLLEALGRGELVRVPTVHWYEADTRLLGQPFFVMERMFGRVPVSSPVYNASGWLHDATPAERRRLWEAAVFELARIHRVPAGSVPFLADPDLGVANLQQLFAEAVDTLHWSAGAEPHPVLDDVLQWLRAHFPAETPVGLAWGDARIGNMMFGDDFGVVGVMDWEQASLGGGLTDLGWWLFFDDFHSTTSGLKRLDGLGSREETVGLWQELTGQPVRDLLWYEVLAGFRLSMFPLQMRDRETGRPAGASPEDSEFLRQVCGLLQIAPPGERTRRRS